MDVNLPDKSGIDLCKEVKQLYPAIAVLGLSTFNQPAIIKNMMDNGALGYVLKNASKITVHLKYSSRKIASH